MNLIAHFIRQNTHRITSVRGNLSSARFNLRLKAYNEVFLSKSSFCSKVPPKNECSQKKIENIEKDDTVELKKLVEMFKYEGYYIPKKISEEQYLELFKLSGENQKIKYLKFLYTKEAAKEEYRALKEKKKSVIEKHAEVQNKSIEHIEYGLWKNTMFIRFTPKTFKSFLNNRLVNALKFNQALVIDLDYYEHMASKDVSSLTKQLKYCILNNRRNQEPFNLMFCNVNFNCEKFRFFSHKVMPNVLNPSFPLITTSRSYLDIFPPKKLVYLTPDARCEMQAFDHDATYVIGGIVEHGRNTPLTLAKAKRENIKTMKLPLDRYDFQSSRILDLQVMLDILLDIRDNGDWETAIKTIQNKYLKTRHDKTSSPEKKRKKCFKDF